MNFVRTFWVVFVFSASVGWAGVETHGGGAFVCRDKNKKISTQKLSVELLDLWEAPLLYKLSIPRDFVTPWEDQAQRALQKLKAWDPQIYQWTMAVYPDVTNNVEEKPKGTIIERPHDTSSALAKENCPLEGVAAAVDQNAVLYVDFEIFAAMSNTDRAALFVHEAVYKALRLHRKTPNSIEARRIVAFLFSNAKVPDYFADAPKDAVLCEDKDRLFVFKLWANKAATIEQQTYHLSFSRIGGQPLMSEAKAKGSWVTRFLSALTNGVLQAIYVADGPVSDPEAATLYAHSANGRFQISLLQDPQYSKVYCR